MDVPSTNESEYQQEQNEERIIRGIEMSVYTEPDLETRCLPSSRLSLPWCCCREVFSHGVDVSGDL